MTTHLIYFEDTYKFTDQAVIQVSNKDENGNFLILNQTIFYPQGGGQPSDQGRIEVGDLVIPIGKVKSVGNEIRHYTDQDYRHLVGQTGTCLVEQKVRLLHARLHTSGHLISNIIEALYPHWLAVKGHHFPGECYVEFNSKKSSSEEISIELINKEIGQFIEKDCLISMDQVSGDKLQVLCPNITYSVPSDQPIRLIRIGDFPFSPCGGTHVKSLKEINDLEITKCKIKKNVMKIYYHMV